MTAFDTAITFVLKHEGGLSDNPSDPGGLTKYGISHRSHPNVDIRNLTIEQAKDIYHRDYWDRCNCGNLPAALGILLFDAAVNQGPSASIRNLQRALGVKADGVIGPVTLTAASTDLVHEHIAEFIARRALSYAGNPNISIFGLGWFRRLAAAHQLVLTL